jgi:hypothetical protein
MSKDEPNTTTLVSLSNKAVRADVQEEEGEFGLLFQIAIYRHYLYEGEERRSSRYSGENELVDLLDVLVQALRYMKKRRTDHRQKQARSE